MESQLESTHPATVSSRWTRCAGVAAVLAVLCCSVAGPAWGQGGASCGESLVVRSTATGQEATLGAGDESLRLQSRTSPRKSVTTVLDRDGRVAEVVVKRRGIKVLIGNMRLDPEKPLTEERKAQLAAFVSSDKAEAIRGLSIALEESRRSGGENPFPGFSVLSMLAGHDQDTRGASPSFTGQQLGPSCNRGDGDMDWANDCSGCCGAGCAACDGCCTTECKEHDDCVEASGQLQCIGLLWRAWRSIGHKCDLVGPI